MTGEKPDTPPTTPPAARPPPPYAGPAPQIPMGDRRNGLLDDLESQTPASDPDDGSDPGSFSFPQPLSSADRTLRRISAICAAVVLVSLAGVPFTPLAWVIPIQGAQIVDWFVSDFVLAAACYFHYRVASLTDAVVVEFPLGDPTRTVIRNGRVQRHTLVPSWTWRPEYWWRFVLGELLLLGYLLFSVDTWVYVARFAAVATVVGSWYVGWSATPQAYKSWAWGHVKDFWFWMAASRIFRGGWVAVRSFGSGRG
ncbi:hypothetical protein GQ53DRAFT_114448 [Thozetella sp. PMI_491]|nr:hypothetical protein GQ53DRAFT_114448 [Thozetella sp. PMI_491]